MRRRAAGEALTAAQEQLPRRRRAVLATIRRANERANVHRLACCLAILAAAVPLGGGAEPSLALPSVDAATCERVPRPVSVDLRRYPNVLDHASDAITPGVRPGDDVPGRYPRVLHIDRTGASARRRAWQQEVRRRGIFPPRADEDRDEYPPALARENDDAIAGLPERRYASRGLPAIRYVDDAENQAAGSSMGGQLRRYCDGQAFRLRLAARADRSPRRTASRRWHSGSARASPRRG